MVLEKRYFGVFSERAENGRPNREWYNCDSVEDVLKIYHELSFVKNINVVGIMDLETNEFVYPEIDDEEKRDIIKYELTQISQA